MRLLLLGAVALFSFAAVSVARAQPFDADTATARALFNEGVQLAQRSDWTGAADRFERVRQLRSSPAVLYNLASALSHVGRLLEASEMLRSVVRDLRPSDPARPSAEQLLHQTESRLGRLTVRVSPDDARAGLSLDGRPMSAATLGVPVPVDPGRHRVVLHRGTIETVREPVVVEGGSVEVRFEPPPSPAPAAIEPPAVPPLRTRSSALGWIAIAGGGVLAAAGVVLLVIAQGDVATVENAPPGSSWSAVQGANDQAPVFSAAGLALAGVGIAGAAIGVYLLATAPRSEHPVAIGIGPAHIDLTMRF